MDFTVTFKLLCSLLQCMLAFKLTRPMCFTALINLSELDNELPLILNTKCCRFYPVSAEMFALILCDEGPTCTAVL